MVFSKFRKWVSWGISPRLTFWHEDSSIAGRASREVRRHSFRRVLSSIGFENFEARTVFDVDDTLGEAFQLGTVSTTARTVSDEISPATDVDMYAFSVASGQVVDFDIDTPLNGPGGLGSYIRLFNSQGSQLDFNDDAAAPGENTMNFDAYLRYAFPTGGIYYLGVSNFNNTAYNPITGNGDTAGGSHAVGTYSLIVKALPIDPDDSLAEAIVLGSISTTPINRSDSIDPDIDVDIYRFNVTPGQVIEFDIDTPINGPGGLGSYIRLFNLNGTQLAFNDDGAATGEVLGFDSFLRYNFSVAGTYYLGVSNFNNVLYNPTNGTGDTAGGQHSIGNYTLTVQATTSSTNDPDDQISEAISLGNITTTAVTRSDNISPDIDVDMFSFTALAGQVIDFDIDTVLNGTGGLGSYIRLFNSTGGQLGFNDDGAAPGENSINFDAYLRHTFATSGTYYLGVSNFNNASYSPLTGSDDTAGGLHATGAYQLIVQALPVDTDDAISESTSLGSVTTTPVTMSASISPDIDVDMYNFTVGAGQVVAFDIDTTTNGPGGLGSYIRLFNAVGTQLAFNDDGAAPGENLGFDAYLQHTFASAGTYYLGVSNHNNVLYNPLTGNGDTAGGFHSIGAYQLIVQTVDSNVSDPDDALNEAVFLGAVSTTPSVSDSSISPDRDVDMYRFTVTAGQVVDFDIDTVLNGPGGLGSYIRLFDSTGAQIDANDDGAAPGENIVSFDSYLRFTFVSAGTYYIGVSNFNNVTYNAVTGDGDTAGGSHTTGNFKLTIQALPVDPDDSMSESIPLGAITTTSILTANTINPDIDVDLYRFTVTAGQVVDFDIDTTLNGPGGLGSYIRLFNNQGAQLAFNDDAAAPGEVVGFDAYLRYTFVTAGTYYLGVSNFNNILYNPQNGNGDTAGGLHSIGAYQFIVQGIGASAPDPDDAISEAISLGAITTTAVTSNNSISPDIDVDMYGFTVTADQVVDFDIDTTLNGPGGLGSYIRLFNAAGVQLDFSDDNAAPGENVVGFDAYLRYTFATAGTYYLGVSNFNNVSYSATSGDADTPGGANTTGDYRLIVQALPIDTDDAISEATQLGLITTTPSITQASITPDIDVDMYRFTVTAGQVVDFDIDTTLNAPGGLGSYIRLFNAQGTELSFNDNAAAPGETLGIDAYLRYTFATAGTYFLGVSNSNNVRYNSLSGSGDTAGGMNSIGDYRLTVQAIEVSVTDTDDAINEAIVLGAVSTTPISSNNSISPDTDVDMYAFTVSDNQTVDFDIDTGQNGPGGLGSYIRLFNSLGNQLDFNDDGIAPGESVLGFDAYLRYTFGTAGTYYLGVSNLNNITYSATTGNGDTAGGLHSTGSYQLIVQALPIDSDDELGEATFLGAISTTASTTADVIVTDIDVDMFRFTVTAGQVVDFDIDTTQNGPGGLGSYIRLFNSQGTQLAANDDGAAPGETVGFDAYLRYTFAAAGTFYLGVSNFNNRLYNPTNGSGDTAGGLHSIGAYQLIVQAVVNTVIDADDQISEAIQLGAVSTAPITSSNNISPDVDVDMFAFSVSAGDIVDFDIDTPQNGEGGLGSYLRLFDASGNQLDFNDDGAAPGESVVGFDAYFRRTFSTGGIFYLGISNNNNIFYNAATGNGDAAGGLHSTGNYQLIIQALPVDTDDALSEANSLGAITTTPNTTSASITPDIDVDMYRFTVTAGQVVDFDIDTPLNGPGGLGSYIRLFNALGTQLASNDDAAAPGETLGFDSYLRYTFATAGTYYLGVSNLNNILYNAVNGNGDTAGGFHSVGAYQLIVREFVATVSDLDDAISEAIPLGVVSTTPVIANNGIAPDTDVDMFAFTVAAGQVVDIDIDTALNGAGGLNSYIRLFNSQGTQLGFNDNSAGPGEAAGFDAYLRHTFITAGTYYLGVSNSNNNQYSPVSGDGDTAGGSNSTGDYQLILQSPQPDVKSLTMSITPTSIPEIGGVAVGIVTRNTADLSQPLNVTLISSNPSAVTLVSSIVIPANQPSGNFQVFPVHDTTRGTTNITITATASGFTPGAQVITITESDFPWQNPVMPTDVSKDGSLSPTDALLVINYLNTPGRGDLPPDSPPPYLDVNGDNRISPADALLVINALNSRGSGEGEASVNSTTGASSASLVDLAFAQGAFDDLTEIYRGRRRQLLK